MTLETVFTSTDQLEEVTLGGTTPDHVFTRILAVPSLLIPYGSPQMHHHAPNERFRLDDLYRGVRSTAAICVALADASLTAAE